MAFSPLDTPTDTCTLCPALARYACPRCETRTCSVACVAAHKKGGCSGKRQRTVFASRADMDAASIQRDLTLLTEVAHHTDHSQRDRLMPYVHRGKGLVCKRQRQGPPAPRRNAPHTQTPGERGPAMDALRKMARRRKVQLLLMPSAMQRARENTSCVLDQGILWHVEWVFGPVRVVSRLYDGLTWRCALQEWMCNTCTGRSYVKELEVADAMQAATAAGPLVGRAAAHRRAWYAQIAPFVKAGMSGVSLHVRVIPADESEGKFRLVGVDDEVAASLHDARIVEYPTVHVVVGAASPE